MRRLVLCLGLLVSGFGTEAMTEEMTEEMEERFRSLAWESLEYPSEGKHFDYVYGYPESDEIFFFNDQDIDVKYKVAADDLIRRIIEKELEEKMKDDIVSLEVFKYRFKTNPHRAMRALNETKRTLKFRSDLMMRVGTAGISWPVVSYRMIELSLSAAREDICNKLCHRCVPALGFGEYMGGLAIKCGSKQDIVQDMIDESDRILDQVKDIEDYQEREEKIRELVVAYAKAVEEDVREHDQ